MDYGDIFRQVGEAPAPPPPSVEPHAAPPESLRENRPKAHPPVRRVAVFGPLLGVTFLAIVIIFAVWRHVQMRQAQETASISAAKQAVTVLTAKRDSEPYLLLLPGNIQAFYQTTIYARVPGYIDVWLVDIGDVVKAGQLLARIATPDVDRQLAQARGQLAQQQANRDLAQISAQRWAQLLARSVVSKEENDQYQSAYKQAEGSLAAAKANVAVLEQMQAFNKVVAPFNGKITLRSIDIGSLVSAGSGTAGTALYNIAQIDPLRIFVYVPQPNAPSIHEGLPAAVLVPEYPGREFGGKVVRTAGAIDPVSRTLLIEVDIPNHDGILFAGMYGEVKFTLQNENAPIIIPDNTVIFRARGPQVATITPGNRVHWVTIQIGTDFGTRLEALTGIKAGMRVVTNPTDDLTEGLDVEVRQPKPAASP